MTQPPVIPEPAPDDVDALAAALRADAADLEIYARVLTTSLAEALPAGMVELEHDQSMRDRLAGRPGVVRALRIDFGELVLELRAGKAALPKAAATRVVRGIVISRREITVEEWTQLLATELAARAKESESARTALERLLGAG